MRQQKLLHSRIIFQLLEDELQSSLAQIPNACSGFVMVASL